MPYLSEHAYFFVAKPCSFPFHRPALLDVTVAKNGDLHVEAFPLAKSCAFPIHRPNLLDVTVAEDGVLQAEAFSVMKNLNKTVLLWLYSNSRF